MKTLLQILNLNNFSIFDFIKNCLTYYAVKISISDIIENDFYVEVEDLLGFEGS